MAHPITKEIEAFEKIEDGLLPDHRGEWAVVKDERLLGIYGSFEEAAWTGWAECKKGHFLIREIGAGAPIVRGRITHDLHD